MNVLTIKGDQFYMGDVPISIRSGALHYFRTVPEYWEDRLKKLKACGFNTVETYVPWNLHEPVEDQYNFEGILNLCQFIQLAKALDLWVIIRPGPYICAEWDFGGLPPWLMKYNIRLRCYDPLYLEKVDRYFDILMDKCRPYLSTNGGPIIAMQVENEYGSYGNDKRYLHHLHEGLIRRGIDVLLFTSDGPTDLMLQGGTLGKVLKTVNFGSKAIEGFEKLREYEKGPLMCMEFWAGWFDAWGNEKVRRDPKDVEKTLRDMLNQGASVNFYMFHGGTNFGFLNGANEDTENGYKPQSTSYDYDALLTECGDMTEKYKVVQKTFKEFFNITADIEVFNVPKKNYGTLEINKKTNLLEEIQRLSDATLSPYPVTFEELEHYFGFVLYRTILKGECKRTIRVDGCRDHAWLYVNGQYAGCLDRTTGENGLEVELKGEETRLDILVENRGRVNYGYGLGEHKGITKGVRIDYQYHFHWEIYKVDFEKLKELEWSNYYDDSVNMPVICEANFNVDEKADTFINMHGWHRGIVFINGFNLGRYDHRGPQETLYIPAPLLNEGDNQIMIFEVMDQGNTTASLCDYPLYKK
ncbi:glycoside hydrolase family 35 protein [Vallitalea okinawensis]|uniref:glycoside hydrolase family 35 protein n=1 Tax=Vallitalea okinawensis TaxID=2078660 RepID=UPI000CFB63A2|nr:beta-galactosidase family protein [Vallitalea okinawensis]